MSLLEEIGGGERNVDVLRETIIVIDGRDYGR